MLEIALNRPVTVHEEQAATAHGLSYTSGASRWRCECGMEFETQDAGFAHLNAVPFDEYMGTGRFFVPLDVVNAHTVSRRKIVSDLELFEPEPE